MSDSSANPEPANAAGKSRFRFPLPSRLRRLLVYTEGRRGRLGMGVVVVALLDLVDVTWPFLLAAAIDAIVLGWGGYAGEDITAQRVAVFCTLIFLLYVIQGYLRYHMRMHFFANSFEIARDLRQRLYRHLTTLPQHYYTRTNTGELMSRLTNDIEAVQRFLGLGLLLAADTTFYFLLVPLPMLYFSWELTLVCLIPMPLIPFLVHRMSRAVHERYEQVQAQFATLSDRAHESLAGIKVVKSFVREEQEAGAFEAESMDYRRRFVRMARIDALFHPVFMLIAGIEFFLILAIGGQFVLAGTLSIGAFAAFFTYVLKLTDPMIEIGYTISLYQRATASLGRIEEILDTHPDIASPPDGGLAPGPDDEGHTPASFAGAITFRNLTFAYPPIPLPDSGDNRNGHQPAGEPLRSGRTDELPAPHPPGTPGPHPPVLRDVSLEIPAGSTLAIMGEVGAGKSTLLSLVPRIVDPPPGAVTIDGHDVRDYDLAWLRRRIGFVPQETFLFSESITGNIALGRPDASETEIREAAAIAKVDRDVAEFPDGYSTMLGERGVNLSGGQKQRVAIARAILRRPRILLLDDCLSAVDSVTEEQILTGLKRVMKRCTTLIVSHRVSTVMHADRIVLLENGGIAEQGTHAELLAANGLYTALWHQQQAGDRSAG